MLFLLFQIGNDRYALEARQAVEVIPFVDLKKIPHAPHGVAGLFSYRGQPVVAVDLCALVFGRPARELFSTRIIIIRVSSSELPVPSCASDPLGTGNSKLLGLIAEHATGMMRREAREFVNPGVRAGDAPYFGSVALDDQGAIQLLHPEHLLTETVRALVPSAGCQESRGAPERASAAAAGPDTPRLTSGTSGA